MKTKGLGGLGGRSGWGRVQRALGSDREPTAEQDRDAAGQQAVPGCAHSSPRLKRLDCAGQRERDVAEGGRGACTAC